MQNPSRRTMALLLLLFLGLALLVGWAFVPPNSSRTWIRDESGGGIGTSGKLPFRRVISWSRHESGPISPGGFLGLFHAGDYLFVIVILATLAALATRLPNAPAWVRSPGALRVRFRSRTALILIAIFALVLKLDMEWEFYAGKLWIQRQYYRTQEALHAGLEEGLFLSRQSHEESIQRMAQSLETRSYLDKPWVPNARPPLTLDEMEGRLRECRGHLNLLDAQIQHHSLLKRKYHEAAMHPWSSVEPITPTTR